MLDENSLIEELRKIETDLRVSGEHRKANMINMAITTMGHCHKAQLSLKDKVIVLMAEFINKISTHNRCKNRCINYCCCDDNCVKNTVEYFENKVKEM